MRIDSAIAMPACQRRSATLPARSGYGRSRLGVKRHALQLGVRVSFVAVLRAFAIVALLVAPVLADDQRSVERLVKNHVANLAKRPKDDQLALAPNALVIIYGADRDPKWSVSDARGGLPGNVAHTAGDATIGVDSDHGVAWFQLPFSVDITPAGAPMGDPSLLHTKERFGGIAVLGKDGWRLAVAMYTRAIDDAQLEAIALPNGDPKLAGDKGLDNVVAGWVKNGFATHAAADLALVATARRPSTRPAMARRHSRRRSMA